MKTKLANHNVETLPQLTDTQREHLVQLAALSDELIDTSDILELSDEAWSAGVRGPRRAQRIADLGLGSRRREP